MTAFSRLSKRLRALRPYSNLRRLRRLAASPLRRRVLAATALALLLLSLARILRTKVSRSKRPHNEHITSSAWSVDSKFGATVDHTVRKWGTHHETQLHTGGSWERIKQDVVIGIKTGHEVAAKRLQKLRQSGWYSVGHDVPNMMVISDSHDDALGVVGVKEYAQDILRNGTETLPQHWFERSGWRGDKDKNLPALHLLKRVFPGKKWYLLLDDDTYILLENFARYVLRDALDHRPIYTGKVFYISRCGGFMKDGTWAANRSEPKGLFAHGGSGIVVNGKAMEMLFPNIVRCIRDYSSCWAGDMQVGLCMRRSGVQLRKHGGSTSYELHFIPFWPSKALSDRRYISRWKSMEEPITFHKIPEEEQILLSGFERDKARKGEIVKYTELREHLLGNGILPCHTEHNKKVKWYTEEFMPQGFKG